MSISSEEQFHGSLASLPLVRQSSSGSMGSHHSQSRTAAETANPSVSNQTPYISIMRHNLNFFMTRLLFMEEEKADSLQARRSRAGNNSSGSLAFNDSRNLNDSKQSMLGGIENAGDDWDEKLLGVTVFQDNARMLPNSAAKSMPPVPFPPAAPESPRAVEGKEGITYITPRHKRLDSLPEALPLSDLSLGYGDDEVLEDLDDLEASQELLPPPEDMDEDLDTKPPAVVPESVVPEPPTTTTAPKQKRKSSMKTPTPFVPPDQRVFPKNQPRRMRAPANPEVRRTQSSRQMEEETKSEEMDDLSKGHSCHSLT